MLRKAVVNIGLANCSPGWSPTRGSSVKIELRMLVVALAAAFVSVALAYEQDVKDVKGAPQVSDQQKAEAARLMKEKKGEITELERRADGVTASIGKLASSGKLGHDQDSLKLMQQMVDELKAIRERLDRMQGEIDEIQSWATGEKKTRPKLEEDVSKLKNFKPTSYIQFQYNNTDKVGGGNDAFKMRRARVGFSDKLAPNASMKVSVDFATGTNQTTAQLREAFLTYDIVPPGRTRGTQAIFGQAPLPVGYEIERSSSVQEFPERAQYNQLLFNGESGRGAMLQHAIDKHWNVHAGVWDALTISDAEQVNVAAGQGDKLGFSGGIRYSGLNYNVGLSGFAGTRPAFTVGANTSPSVDRHFIYADANFEKLLVPQMFLRTEAMAGSDRVPSSTAAPTNVAHNLYGYHVILGYNFDARNQLSLKYEEFDPNRDSGGDLFRGWGLAYNYLLTTGVRFTAAQEFFQDDARAGAPTNQRRFGLTTLRIQFRF